MATYYLNILGHATNPDPADTVFWVPYTIYATNDVWAGQVAVFPDDGTRTGLHGWFTVPQNYVDSADFRVRWTSTAVAGDLEWDVDYRAVGGNDTESLDQVGTQRSLNGNDTAPGAVNRRLDFVIPGAVDGDFSPGDTVEFALFRDGTDGGDGMAASGLLFELIFQYDD